MIHTTFDRDTVRSIVYEMLKEGLEIAVNDISGDGENSLLEVRLTLRFTPEGKGKYKPQAFSVHDSCSMK